MTLRSRLFRNDPKLEAARASDPDHITPGTRGTHVTKIQSALSVLDRAVIAPREMDAQLYGPSTAQAVLAYKRRRRIINHAYQSTADNIVGKMTVVSLDEEMSRKEMRSPANCNCGPRFAPRPRLAFALASEAVGSPSSFHPAPAPGVFPPPPPVHTPLAIQRAPDAAKLAQSTLDVLKSITGGTMQPANAAALATQALQTHYLCTPSEVAQTAQSVKQHLEAIIGVLGRAAVVFVPGVGGDPDGAGAYAYSRDPRDGKIYINPSFTLLAKFGSQLILVHEAFHFLDGMYVDWCHNPDNDGGRGYRSVPKDLRPRNAYVLSQFVLHIHLKGEKTLDVERDEIADLLPP